MDDFESKDAYPASANRLSTQEKLFTSLQDGSLRIGQFMTRYASTLDTYTWATIEQDVVPAKLRPELMLFLYGGSSAPRWMSRDLAVWVAGRLGIKPKGKFVELVVAPPPKKLEKYDPWWFKKPHS